MNRTALVFFTAFSGAVALAAEDPVDGFRPVRQLGGIAEYKLTANDLNVLLLEDHSAPVLTFMVTYRVGSRHEVTGTTGATHLLEHLMFKGSKNFHPGVGKGFDTLMDRVGGINNATTSLDRTNYYENLPSDQLELAVQLEADRMRGLLLREEDRQPEMTVVRNEFERGENDPGEALEKEVNAAAFIAHPYHHPIIGWRSDIEKVSIEKLRAFYDTFYWPNNATISVVGDFDPRTALRLIKRHFGGLPRSPQPIPAIYTEEPPQTGPRRVTVKRPGEVGAVQVAFKVPAGSHADHPALDLLAMILSAGKTSRLYRSLIDTNLALTADAAKGYFHDGTLFSCTALLAPGATHEQVEKALLAAVDAVRTDGVTAAEVARAISQRIARIAYGRDGSFAIAGQINEDIAVGDWTLYLGMPEKLRAVTAAEVNRVAKAYLQGDQSTTGWFIPTAEGAGRTGANGASPKRADAVQPDWKAVAARFAARGPHFYRDPAESAPGATRGWWAPPLRRPLAAGAGSGVAGGGVPAESAGGAPVAIASKVRRRMVAGVDVVTLRTAIKDVVTIVGVLGAGDVFNPRENSALADLTAGMLDQGTVQRDKFAVAGVLEEVGAALGFGAGSHTLNFSGKCLRKNLARIVGLLGEQLRSPRLDAGELAKLKLQLSGRHKREMEDPDFRADTAFRRAIFPAGHPNRPPADEQYMADIEAATLEQLRAFHATHYGPAGARIVAVGDVDDDVIDQAVSEAFAGWNGGRAFPAAAPAAVPAAARTESVVMPGKTSVTFVVGLPSGLRYRDPEHLSLNLATAILGSGFFSARLLDIVRNREGLTYGIGAALDADTYADGAWRIQGTFAPELLEKGAASTRRELQRFWDAGVTAEELETFKVTLTGSYKLTLATTEGLASVLLNALQRGLGPEWVDEFPRRLQAQKLEQVNAAIKKFLDPARMVTVMAGTLPPAGKQ